MQNNRLNKGTEIVCQIEFFSILLLASLSEKIRIYEMALKSRAYTYHTLVDVGIVLIQ